MVKSRSNNKFLKLRKSFSIVSFCFYLLSTFYLVPRIIVILTRESFYNGDSAFFFFITKDIVIDHKIALIGSYVGNLGGFAQSAGWNYLLALSFIFSKGDPRAAEILMFAISVLTLICGSYLFWRMLGKIEGILIGFFLGMSPYLIMYSNRVLPPYVIPFLVIFYLSFLILFLKYRKAKYFIFLTVILGSTFLIEIASFGILLPSYLLLSCYLIYSKRLKIKFLLISLVCLAVFFIPHLIYDLSHSFYNIKGVIAILPFTRISYIHSNLGLNLKDRLHLFRTDMLSIFPTLPFFPLYLFVLFMIIGIFIYVKDKKIDKWKKIFLMYIASTIALSFIILIAVPTKHADIWWLTVITILYICVAGIVLGYIILKRHIILKLIAILFLLLFINSAVANLNQLINKRENLQDIKYVIPYTEPIEYIYNDADDKPARILYLTGDKDVLAYKYVFWYIGYSRYRNSQVFKSLDLRYNTAGGYRFPNDEVKQFENISKGQYYLIIDNKSIKNGNAKKLIEGRLKDKVVKVKHLDMFDVYSIIIGKQ